MQMYRHATLSNIQLFFPHKETICAISRTLYSRMIPSLLVCLLSTLYYLEHTHICIVIVWSIFTAQFIYIDMPLLATILFAIFWNLVLLGVLLITTFLPQYTRKGFLCLAVVGALLPNLFAHPLHIHPVRLAIRAGITFILPKKYIWYVCVPEWFIGIVIWRMLRHHYPSPSPNPPVVV